MKTHPPACLLTLLLSCLLTTASAQEPSSRIRSFQEGDVTVKNLNFGPGQHHLTVQAESPQTLNSIQQVWRRQANALCEKPANLLDTRAEQRWITTKDSNDRDIRVRLFVAFGLVICP
jgi:hypothetical protein